MDEQKLVWVVTGSSNDGPIIFSAPYSEEDAVEDAIYFASVNYNKKVSFTKIYDTQSYVCTDPECPVVIISIDPTKRRSPVHKN